MEVVPLLPPEDAPFKHRNVEEWSRLNEITGALERARFESDHWVRSHRGGQSKYGKVVDSRQCSMGNGGVEQRHQQMEVFEAKIPGGSLQVIRTQRRWQHNFGEGLSHLNGTEEHKKTGASSSRWSTNSQRDSASVVFDTRSTASAPATQTKDFENLELAINPLDLTSQKRRGSIGRSGSIGSRRPPSRSRRVSVSSAVSEEVPLPLSDEEEEDEGHSQLPFHSSVSELCKKIHEERKSATSNKSLTDLSPCFSPVNVHHDFTDSDLVIEHTPERIRLHRSGDSADVDDNVLPEHLEEGYARHSTLDLLNGCHLLDKNKSNSSDNIADEVEDIPEWKRNAKVRRSLQFPLEKNSEPFSYSGTSLVGRQEMRHKTRRLINGYDMSFQDNGESDTSPSIEGFSRVYSSRVPATKRHSFVTVESLKEVRGRLRRLRSPVVNGVADHSIHPKSPGKSLLPSNHKKVDDVKDQDDDGFATEDPLPSPKESLSKIQQIKTYMFGMSSSDRQNSNDNPIQATGSLESRSSRIAKTDEWYNRRKSYGFEPVKDAHQQSFLNQDKLGKKVESTDSGISQSAESLVPHSKTYGTGTTIISNDNDRLHELANGWSDSLVKTSHSVRIIGNSSYEYSVRNGTGEDDRVRTEVLNPSGKDQPHENDVKVRRKTVITLGASSETSQCSDDSSKKGDANWILKAKDRLSKVDKAPYSNQEDVKHDVSRSTLQKVSEPITITIPISSHDRTIEDKKGNNVIYHNVSNNAKLTSESGKHNNIPLLKIANIHSGTTEKNATVSSEEFQYKNARNMCKTSEQVSEKSDNGTLKYQSSQVKHNKVMDIVRNFGELRTTSEPFSKVHNNSSYLSHKDSSDDFRLTKSSNEAKTQDGGKDVKKLDRYKDDIHFRTPGISITFQDSATQEISGNVSRVSLPAVLSSEEQSPTEDRNENFNTQRRQKKVEFDVMEIHIPAESGKVHIVETAGKPPPSNSYRRKRRSNVDKQQAEKRVETRSNLPEVRFGDTSYEKQLLSVHNDLQHVPSGVSVPEVVPQDDDKTWKQVPESSPSSEETEHIFTTILAKDSDPIVLPELALGQNQDTKPRSILKNKRSTFCLGEEPSTTAKPENLEVSSAEIHANVTEGQTSKKSSWGVNLKPVNSRQEADTTPIWRSSVTMKNTKYGNNSKLPLDSSSSGEMELQKLLRSLRPTGPKKSGTETVFSSNNLTRSGIEVKIGSSSGDSSEESSLDSKGHSFSKNSGTSWLSEKWSRTNDGTLSATVHQNDPKGYSTRVNLTADSTTVEPRDESRLANPTLFKKEGKVSSITNTSQVGEPTKETPVNISRSQVAQKQHCSYATSEIEAYNKPKLKSVETLVSTRSGSPKITSISLHYDDDDSTKRHVTGKFVGKESLSENICLIKDEKLEPERKSTVSYARKNYGSHAAQLIPKEHAIATKTDASESFVNVNREVTSRGSSPIKSPSPEKFVTQTMILCDSVSKSDDRNAMKEISPLRTQERNTRRAQSPLRKVENDRDLTRMTYTGSPITANRNQDPAYLQPIAALSKWKHDTEGTSTSVQKAQTESPKFGLKVHKESDSIRYQRNDSVNTKHGASSEISNVQKERSFSPTKGFRKSPVYFGLDDVTSSALGEAKDTSTSVSLKSLDSPRKEIRSQPSEETSNDLDRRRNQSTGLSLDDLISPLHSKETSSMAKKVKKEESVDKKLDIRENESKHKTVDQKIQMPRAEKCDKRQDHASDTQTSMKYRSEKCSVSDRSSTRRTAHLAEKNSVLSVSDNKKDVSPSRGRGEILSHKQSPRLVRSSSSRSNKTTHVATYPDESSMLEELTRAADEILQAVNGYTDESHPPTSDDDSLSSRSNSRRSSQRMRKCEKLGTITEDGRNKATGTSARRKQSVDDKKENPNVKSPVRSHRRTSSTSSVESMKDTKTQVLHKPPASHGKLYSKSQSTDKHRTMSGQKSSSVQCEKQRISKMSTRELNRGSSSEDVTPAGSLKRQKGMRKRSGLKDGTISNKTKEGSKTNGKVNESDGFTETFETEAVEGGGWRKTKTTVKKTKIVHNTPRNSSKLCCTDSDASSKDSTYGKGNSSSAEGRRSTAAASTKWKKATEDGKSLVKKEGLKFHHEAEEIVEGGQKKVKATTKKITRKGSERLKNGGEEVTEIVEKCSAMPALDKDELKLLSNPDMNRKMKTSASGEGYSTVTRSSSGDMEKVTREGVQNRVMSSKEIIEGGNFTASREVTGSTDQRVVVEETSGARNASRSKRTVTHSSTSSSVVVTKKKISSSHPGNIELKAIKC